MASNVPAINDVFATRIRACVARPGLQKCAGMRRGSERSDRPSRMEAKPPYGGAAFIVLLGAVAF